MIALDSNLFIYMLEAHAEFGELAKQLFLAIEQTHLDGCASELTFMEVLASGSFTKKQQEQTNASLEKLGIIFKPISKLVLLEAARLRRVAGLGPLDSIHAASALLAGCSQLVTNDRKLLNKTVPGLKMVSLLNINEAILSSGDRNRLAP